VTGQAAGPVWPSAAPPRADGGVTWELDDIAQLPALRAEVREYAARYARGTDRDSADLRHGGGWVRASLALTPDCYLVEVTDTDPGSPPVPAVGRDPSEGGLGLYLIAELASRHGWYVSEDAKHVWALLPRG
jgi:hypothetical protein